MYQFAIKRIQSVWKGPAFTLHVGGLTYKIGEGKAAAEVSVKKLSIMNKMFWNPSLGFGEAYMKGDIEISGDILAVLHGFYVTGDALRSPMMTHASNVFKRLIPGRISTRRAIANARHHYDVGNDFYKLWLDPSLAYTCAYYANEHDSLATAQQQKFELVCKKVRLEKGQHIIDLGCGWGGLIFYAAEHYGAHATGVVAAKEQAAFIREEAKRRGLEDKITVQCSDWRDATGMYDRVVSVGMLEHVGLSQYGEFFLLVNKLLAEDGVAFVHTIGRMASRAVSDSWISKYIFPGYFVPSLEEMAHFAANAGLHITDTENLWKHYVKTLTHWAENYAKHRDQIIAMYDEEFDRMWWLYLMGSVAAFQWGGLNLWQMVMTKGKEAPWPLQREVGVGKGPQSE